VKLFIFHYPKDFAKCAPTTIGNGGSRRRNFGCVTLIILYCKIIKGYASGLWRMTSSCNYYTVCVFSIYFVLFVYIFKTQFKCVIALFSQWPWPELGIHVVTVIRDSNARVAV